MVCTLLKNVVAAIEDDNASGVREALDCGLDPESRYEDTTENRHGGNDGTLLHWAARYDSSDSAKVFEIHQFVHPFTVSPRCLSSPVQTSKRRAPTTRRCISAACSDRFLSQK